MYRFSGSVLAIKGHQTISPCVAGHWHLMPSSIPSLGSIEACLSCHILSPTTCSLGRTAEQRHRDNVKEYSVSHILRISSRIYGKERNSIMLQIERNYTICQGRSQWGINLVTCTSETRAINRKWLPGFLLLQTMFLFLPKGRATVLRQRTTGILLWGLEPWLLQSLQELICKVFLLDSKINK